MRDRDIQGVCGQATGLAMGTVVGVPLSIAFAPITVPIFFATGLYHDPRWSYVIILRYLHYIWLLLRRDHMRIS
jgi:hypothetical protein